MAKFRTPIFVLRKTTDRRSKHFDVQEKWTELFGRVDVRITMSLQTLFLEP